MQDEPDKNLFDHSHLLPDGAPPLPLPAGPYRFFVHIPNLCLGDGLRIPFRRGELRFVSFDEWRVLDQEVAEKRTRLYEGTRPVFFVVDEEVATERIFTRIRSDAQVLFSILTLSGMRADLPDTSTAYVSCERAIVRRIGVHDRRSILSGPIRWHLLVVDDEFLDMVSSLDRQAAAFDLPEVSRAVQACNFGDGDANLIDAIMRLTVALEALLLEDVTTGITATFAKRVGQFVLESGEIASELERDLRTLYALRSDALHGRDWASTIAGTCRVESAWASWAHGILLRALKRVVNQVGCATDSRQALTELRLDLVS